MEGRWSGGALGLALAVVVLGATPGGVAAQADAPATRVWMGLGLGTAEVRDLDADAGGTVQVTVQRGAHHWGFRALSLGDFRSASDDAIREVGLLYGRTAASSFGYVVAAAGVALVTAKGLPDAGPDDRRVAGMPVVVEAGLRSRFVGLGIQGFGNLNSLSRFAGVALYVNLGWMP